MTITDRRRQPDGATQDRIGLLVVLNERLPLGDQCNHVVRRPSIRRQLCLQWTGELHVILWGEHVE